MYREREIHEMIMIILIMIIIMNLIMRIISDTIHYYDYTLI